VVIAVADALVDVKYVNPDFTELWNS
jgi:hypothetical protein